MTILNSFRNIVSAIAAIVVSQISSVSFDLHSYRFFLNTHREYAARAVREIVQSQGYGKMSKRGILILTLPLDYLLSNRYHS
jgi:hypothetical protein